MVASLNASICPLSVWDQILAFPEQRSCGSSWSGYGVYHWGAKCREGPRQSLALTWHVHHAAVTVLHDVAGLTVNPTGGDTVNRKEVESHL